MPDRLQVLVLNVKKLLPTNESVKGQDVSELIKLFANTWFSLGAYDKSTLPKRGLVRKEVHVTGSELENALVDLREELISKKEASELFGVPKDKKNIGAIIGSIFQTYKKQDFYPTLEEKAAHLLYFVVKDHLFIDGNKRSGAFAFIWFLKKAGVSGTKLTPEALTVLTLLVAESNPKDKDRIIGLILLILQS